MTTVHRIAIVSSGGSTGIGASLCRGFQQAGQIAMQFDEPWVRARRLSGPSLSLKGLLPRAAVDTRSLVQNSRSFAPTLIIVIKGLFMLPQHIRALQHQAPVICWNPDSPFDASLSNSGGVVSQCVSHYDAYITWSKSIGSALSDLCDRVYIIPFGIDSSLHCPGPGGKDSVGRVVFIGTAAPERIRLIRRMAHLQPVIYGNGWRGVDADIRKPISGRDFASVAAGAAWCLNLLRPQNRDSHNMRSFELMACGARQLTFQTADHSVFLAGSGAVTVPDTDSLIRLAGTTPPTTARPGTAEHSYRERCGTLLSLLEADQIIACRKSP